VINKTTNEYALFDEAIQFLQTIGIEIKDAFLEDEDCFLPGFLIKDGIILIDKSKVMYPGDILHEAAHIAIVPAAERYHLQGENMGQRSNADAEEMMSIAWSYAACIHLNIDPHFVFHEYGYKGAGASIVENFNKGNYFGVPVLQWLGMTTTENDNTNQKGFPVMIKWLRD
jgi:hypothetical protein